MRFLQIIIATIASVLCLAQAQGSAVLVTDNGQLIGANGVEFDADFFDVRFIDGTCADLFGICSSSNFTFQTQAKGFLAAAALRDQVFATPAGAPYDIDPELTLGCSNHITCQILIPIGTFSGHLLNNAIMQNPDGIGINGIGSTRIGVTSDNLANDVRRVYASFTPSTAVPLPSALVLFLSGITGLILKRKIA